MLLVVKLNMNMHIVDCSSTFLTSIITDGTEVVFQVSLKLNSNLSTQKYQEFFLNKNGLICSFFQIYYVFLMIIYEKINLISLRECKIRQNAKVWFICIISTFFC